MSATVQSEVSSVSDACAKHHPEAWFIVTQVKANRVVYFTDDPAYQPPTEGDWYFVSHHLGSLPPGMTLRNCWGWRYNGVFSDAREARRPSAPEALLESNRRALRKLLCDKINAARRAWCPATELGSEIRREKLDQARRYLAGGAGVAANAAGRFALIEGTAAARNIAVVDAARLVISQDQAMWEGLARTEVVRERYEVAIQQAFTLADLIALRKQLLEQEYTAQSAACALPVAVMEPQDWTKPLSDVHRTHEIARLGAQLREIVNARRASVHRSYIDDDIVLRHKAQLAQHVLNNENGEMDLKLLDNFSRVHKLSLADAARLVLGAMNEAQQVLTNTEIAKDRLLADIESVENLRDVQRVSAALDALSLSI